MRRRQLQPSLGVRRGLCWARAKRRGHRETQTSRIAQRQHQAVVDGSKVGGLHLEQAAERGSVLYGENAAAAVLVDLPLSSRLKVIEDGTWDDIRQQNEGLLNRLVAKVLAKRRRAVSSRTCGRGQPHMVHRAAFVGFRDGGERITDRLATKRLHLRKWWRRGDIPTSRREGTCVALASCFRR